MTLGTYCDTPPACLQLSAENDDAEEHGNVGVIAISGHVIAGITSWGTPLPVET